MHEVSKSVTTPQALPNPPQTAWTSSDAPVLKQQGPWSILAFVPPAPGTMPSKQQVLSNCFECELKLVHFTEIKFRMGMKENQDLKQVKGGEPKWESHLLSVIVCGIALILFKTVLFY